MLNFVMGLSGSGKTTYMLNEIRTRTAKKQRCVLIVPEQFSSTAEINCCVSLGDENSEFLEVYSFRSFAEKIQDIYGGAAAKTVTDAARAVLVRRAAAEVGDSLRLFKKQIKSTGFCTLCADMIKELKIAGITPGALIDAGSAAQNGERLGELGLVFSAYEALLSQTGVDPTDRISLAAQKLQAEYLADKYFYIDDFDGFTAPEYKLLEKIITYAGGITVGLCAPDMNDKYNGTGLFSPVQKTARRLFRIANGACVKTAKTVTLAENRRAGTADTLYLERFARGEVCEDIKTDGSVRLTAEKSVYAEAKSAAAEILRLHEEKGVNYENIAVICRDFNMYAQAADEAFGLYGIPYFCDNAQTAEYIPAAAFIRAALAIGREGLTSKNILALLKTRLTDIPPETVAELENYAYIWQLKAADWKKPFINNPDGFTSQKIKPQAAQLLERLEKARDITVKRLSHFTSAIKKQNGTEISRALYLLMCEFGADKVTEQAAKAYREQNDLNASAETVRMWDIAMRLLDEISDILADDAVTAQEYDELFALLLRCTELGRLPKGRGMVQFGTADRMRTDDIKYSFILGMNEDVFPATVGASGLLTHNDREILSADGIDMPGKFENRVLLEDMYLYRALSSASDGVYIYFHTQSGRSAAMPDSAAAQLLKKDLFKPVAHTLPRLCRTEKAAADMLSECYRQNDYIAPTIAAALEKSRRYTAVLENMKNAANKKDFSVEDTSALQKLVGDTVVISPTRAESYYSCRFAYFLEYILKVKPRRKAELNVMETGTFVHYLLENVLRQSPDLEKLTKAQIKQRVWETAEKYTKEYFGGVDNTERFKIMIDKLCANVAELIGFIQSEQAQGSFHPADFELEISDGGDVKPMELYTEDNRRIKVVGKIDRVDVFKKDGKSYLRVVDYKTGNKEFKLDEVYNGINTQMLLYLFTLTGAEKPRYENPVPAGVLYLLSDPSPKTYNRDKIKDDLPVYKVDGIVLQDTETLKAMDSAATGLFVPLTFTANGTPRKAANNLASLEKLGRIQARIQKLVRQMATQLCRGKIEAAPLVHHGAIKCDFCDYRTVCRREDGENERQLIVPENLFEKEEGEENER